MNFLTLRDNKKAPLKYRWLLRVMYCLSLAPAVLLVHSRDMHLKLGADVGKLTREFWQDAHWVLSPPTDFWPPLLTFIGDMAGFSALPETIIPLSCLVLAGCILGSIAASLDRRGNLTSLMVIIALALGATPLFLRPLVVGDPIFWGPGLWFFAVRSLTRIESRDKFQHELVLGVSLAMLLLLDPAAPLMILGVFLFLPLILPRTSKRTYLEAWFLTISPAMMVVFLQISSYAILHSIPLISAIRMWADRFTGTSDFFRFAWEYHRSLPSSGQDPHFLRDILLGTPWLPLAIYLPTVRQRKYHPGTLAAVLVLPLLNGLIYSAHAGAAADRIWALYLLLGMMAWLAETPQAGRWGRTFTLIICLWPLIAGWITTLN